MSQGEVNSLVTPRPIYARGARFLTPRVYKGLGMSEEGKSIARVRLVLHRVVCGRLKNTFQFAVWLMLMESVSRGTVKGNALRVMDCTQVEFACWE